MPRPAKGTYPEYFEKYINLVTEKNLKAGFRNQQKLINSFFNDIPDDKTEFSYGPGKWTLKEMLQHIIDTERIFNYRALAFARKETLSLPSFDENTYAENSNANARNWKKLCNELKAVRKSTRMMYDSFSKEALNSSGIANNNPMTVNAMGFTSIGHIYHHMNVVRERYLEKGK
jgi:hypothetical protein